MIEMSYLKKILTSSKEIIITYLLSYFIILISCLIYTCLGHQDLTKFINTYCIYILLTYYLLTILYLFKKNYIKEKKLSIKKYFSLISIGISIACFMNMLIYKIIPPQETSTIALPIAFLSSGLIGPIYEEILFRYLFFNRLKKYFSKKKAILITTLIFALIHLSSIKIIYAFFLGLILTISYEKYQTILAPVLIHIFANSIVLFLNEYNTYILLLSIINLGLNIKQIAPKNRFQS